MRIAYFYEPMLPGQEDVSWVLPRTRICYRAPGNVVCQPPGADRPVNEHEVKDLTFAPSSANSLVRRSLDFTQNQNWNSILKQQQAVYDELLANQEWAHERERPAPAPSRLPLSALEITQEPSGLEPAAGRGATAG